MLTGASRPIKPSEVDMCGEANVEYIELPVAYDGLAVVVNKANDWVDHMTVAELKKLWAPEAQNKVTRWAQVRKGWPDKKLLLFGPGVDSGTYDYFTKAIVGKEHSSRGDFTSSEDDNVLVQGVASDTAALGFFGYAYYAENKDRLKLVTIDDGKDDNGKGPIAPSLQTVGRRHLSAAVQADLHLRQQSGRAAAPEVKRFVDFYLDNASKLSRGRSATSRCPARRTRWCRSVSLLARWAPSSAAKGATVGVSVEELLGAE